jgi:hypothetical protein
LKDQVEDFEDMKKSKKWSSQRFKD